MYTPQIYGRRVRQERAFYDSVELMGWVEIFLGKFSREEFDGWKFVGGEFSRGGFS